ncbi:MobC family plasmid mobilization relaxosome protein [Streptomyces sp. NPDC051561]|uniref:MobC family plasmid mobilization relaxosome protein n=1 Tax=Streptomyces sp. NPDC051561 TaxID=3365658 RepID=UPI0037B7208B
MTVRDAGSVDEPSGESANWTSTRASYLPSYSSPSGKAAWRSPAPGVAGADQRQGAPVREAAAEGGPQPGEATSSAHRTAPPATRKRSPMQRDRKRVHMCNVRLNDEERDRLTAAARTVRTSLPAYLVRAGLAAAHDPETTEAAVAARRDIIAELFSARRHLGKVGSNLNQIARSINSGGHPEEVDVVIAAVQRAVQRVQEATDQVLHQP